MIKAIIELDGLLERLQTIEELLMRVQPDTQDRWITNEEFCMLLDVCAKTAQTYRDKGLIRFSQVGSKIRYRMSSIDQFLDNHSAGGFSGKTKRV